MAYNDDLKRWQDSEWFNRRQEHKKFREWYDGVPLEQTDPGLERKTGEQVKRYPLDINLAKLSCDLHRDIARGTPQEDAPLFILSKVERKNLQPEIADSVEILINDTWRHSYGGAIQQEGLLDMNIYGGVVYKLAWEPWSYMLPSRIAIRRIGNPGYIKPVWDSFDPWRMQGCYVGFEISNETAEAKYNVEGDYTRGKSLYMEYWSKDEWWVHVNGQTPSMSWNGREWRLSGENEMGFVPIYYIPHERTTKLFGISQIDGQDGLVKEFNARAANVADIVRSARPGMWWGHDLDDRLEVTPIRYLGKILGRVVNAGRTRGMQGANAPELSPLPTPDVPEGTMDYPDTLLRFWMLIQRVSPSTFGMDDTQSGRITGPATAQRMFTSIAHSATERMNYTTGKCVIDQDIIAMMRSKIEAGGYEGLTPPTVPDVDPYQLKIKQNWPPMIPLDRQQRHTELVESLQADGISIEQFLREKGVEDIETGRKEVLQWLEDKLKLEYQYTKQQGAGNANQGNNN